MEDTFGRVTSSEKRSRTSEVDFKASVKCSLKRYTSELEPAKLLVLLLVKYCLDGSFGDDICRRTCYKVEY